MIPRTSLMVRWILAGLSLPLFAATLQAQPNIPNVGQ